MCDTGVYSGVCVCVLPLAGWETMLGLRVCVCVVTLVLLMLRKYFDARMSVKWLPITKTWAFCVYLWVWVCAFFCYYPFPHFIMSYLPAQCENTVQRRRVQCVSELNGTKVSSLTCGCIWKVRVWGYVSKLCPPWHDDNSAFHVHTGFGYLDLISKSKQRGVSEKSIGILLFCFLRTV